MLTNPMDGTMMKTGNYNYSMQPLYANNNVVPVSFLGQDISLQIHLDALISQHMEKVRVELEQKRRRLMEAIEVEVRKKLKSKEEEILRMEKLNWALEERVRALCVENEIWRDVARTKEATANALRTNLEQVLAHVHVDAQSCCDEAQSVSDWERRLCTECGKEESCVLILPCRHLCVCTLCVSRLHACPVCKSFKNATLHVNFTS